MLNLAGWVTFVITSIVALSVAWTDYKKYGYRPKTLKFYLNLIALIGVALGIAIYPFEKIKNKKESDALLNDIKLINKKTASLQAQNEEFTIQNHKLFEQNALLKEKINFTQKDLKTYKGQISQFSINFSTFFTINSLVDYSSDSIIPFPDATYARIVRDDLNNFFNFQTSDNSYSYSAVQKNMDSIMYAFQIKSEVKNGHNPIGQSFDVLKSFSLIQLFIPAFAQIPKDDALSRKVKILNCVVNFTINGKNLAHHAIKCPANMESIIGDSIYGSERNWFTIQFKTPKNIYDTYNLSKF